MTQQILLCNYNKDNKEDKVLILDNIKQAYKNSTILKDINLKLPVHRIIGIIGPNGAGKSTLLKIIAGFQIPCSGKIWFNDILLENFYTKREIFSYMPEYIYIYPHYKVKEFIKFVQQVSKYYNPQLLKILKLDKVNDKKIKHLSKGFHQRLKLFFALHNDKKIVILDEPFDGFDPIQLLDIIRLIKKEKRNGRTFIVSIHQLSLAEKICDHYILLNEGKLIADGDMKTLKQTFNITENSLEQIFIKAMT